MDNSVQAFYDQLAHDYHLIFSDWSASVSRQAEILDRMISAELGPPPRALLDCTCGIGTQAIGLALRGYRVHATDLSPTEVKRAKREAKGLGASLTFGVADVRTLAQQVPGTFDVVISCDNALPHLLTDDDLRAAARSIRSKLRHGGLFLASIRDYDQIIREKPTSDPPRIFDGPTGRRIVFQVWDWLADGRGYVLTMFIVQQTRRGWKTRHYATRYRALQRDELREILESAGFSEIRWRMPDDTGYYQPIVTARGGDD